MSGLLHSDDWYRFAPLRPFLRRSTQMSRHVYRGEVWYVLRDPATGDHHRINRLTYELISRLDGEVTLDAVHRQMLETLGDEAPTQDELIVAIAHLAEANLLQAERASDMRQLRLRSQRRKRHELMAGLNPLSFKVAIFDPSGWVERLASPLAPLFSRAGAIGCGMLMLWAALVAIGQFDRLQSDIRHLGAGTGFWFLMWIAYPLLKLAHEFAHALVVRRFGGEVREMGVRLLVLMPVPYVDASSATLFANKHERALVSAAGILAEGVIASGALLLWAVIEPGLVHDLCLAFVVIGTVSTVLFNGNPLLKFDGYHVLCDLFELPNLAPRARQYFQYCLQRHLLGIEAARRPGMSQQERRWLLGYGVASWTYRSTLFMSIAIYVGSLSWAAGLAILALGLWTLLLGPALKAADFVLHSSLLNGRRHRALGLYGGALAAVLVLLGVPAPATTVAMGVVWLPERAQIRTEVPGTIVALLARDNEAVRAGQPVIRLANDELQLQVLQAEAAVQSLRTRQIDQLRQFSQEAALTGDKLEEAQARLQDARHRLDALVLRANADGRFVLPRAADRLGSWLDQGSTVAYILDAPTTTIRLALPNDTADRVRDQVRGIEVRLADRSDSAFTASIVADSPGGSDQLPSAALGAAMGGRIATDPGDASGLKPTAPVFLLDVAIADLPTHAAGQRALVRFDHPATPLALQAHDALRRLFLRHFST